MLSGNTYNNKRIYQQAECQEHKILDIKGTKYIRYNLGTVSYVTGIYAYSADFNAFNFKFVITNYLDISPLFFLFFGLIDGSLRIDLNG